MVLGKSNISFILQYYKYIYTYIYCKNKFVVIFIQWSCVQSLLPIYTVLTYN